MFVTLDFVLAPIEDVRTFRVYNQLNPSQVITMFNQIEWMHFYSHNNPNILVPFFNRHFEQLFDACVIENHPQSYTLAQSNYTKRNDPDLAFRELKVS